MAANCFFYCFFQLVIISAGAYPFMDLKDSSLESSLLKRYPCPNYLFASWRIKITNSLVSSELKSVKYCKKQFKYKVKFDCFIFSFKISTKKWFQQAFKAYFQIFSSSAHLLYSLFIGIGSFAETCSSFHCRLLASLSTLHEYLK